MVGSMCACLVNVHGTAVIVHVILSMVRRLVFQNVIHDLRPLLQEANLVISPSIVTTSLTLSLITTVSNNQTQAAMLTRPLIEAPLLQRALQHDGFSLRLGTHPTDPLYLIECPPLNVLIQY